MSAAVVWFRRDLRLNDNPALAAAAAGADQVIAVFCFEPGLLRGRHWSPNRNAFLLASLRELDQRLRMAGGRLHYREGDPAAEVPRLAEETGADEVHVNRDYTAHARARDRQVAARLESAGSRLVGHDGLTCAEISAIERSSGAPYRIFTPFFRRWLTAGRREPARRPRKLPHGNLALAGRAPSAGSLGISPGHRRRADGAGAGESAGRARMRAAVASARRYSDLCETPADDATTRLSPALHLGTVSPRELEDLLIDVGSEGASSIRRQLAWRDFWLNIVHHFPANRHNEHDARLRGMSWSADPAEIEAWKQGRTGVPWIDAGMRQLLAEGWMHNRLRMAVASYLTKNLDADWREGEAHFMAHLLDGDESQNNGNWQWAASVGADAQPYFRVFNPVRQQRRFDPRGVFVRRWVPELARLPDEHLATPWLAPEEILAEAGVKLGEDYPHPLVDLSESRHAAIQKLAAQRAG